MSLWLWIKSIIRHWWALMSCAAFTFLGMWTLYADKNNRWALQATFSLAVLCLFWACYLSWEIEHEALVEYRAKLEARIPLLGVEVWDVLLIQGPTSVDVFFEASINNATHDTPCTVRAYEAKFESGQEHVTLDGPIYDLGSFNLVELQNGKEKSTPLKNLAEGIDEDHPISYGVPHRGWLHFVLSNRVMMSHVKAAILYVYGYEGPVATSMTSVNWDGKRHVKRKVATITVL